MNENCTEKEQSLREVFSTQRSLRGVLAIAAAQTTKGRTTELRIYHHHKHNYTLPQSLRSNFFF